MSKDQAILIMGNPTSTSAPGGGEEILIYELTETRAAEEYNYTNEYYVRVVGGLVESYGRMGNCDTSTRDSLLLIDF